MCRKKNPFSFFKNRCSPVSPRPANGGGGGGGGGGGAGAGGDSDSPRKSICTKAFVSPTGRSVHRSDTTPRSVNPYLAVRQVLPLHLDDFDADKSLGLVGGVLF